MRVGQGVDAHRLVAGRPLRLGGVEIPHERGLEGHSDGDVLLHAVASALLGAIGAGDLGTHFPSSDARWRGADSGVLLEAVVALLRERGFAIGNLDATVIAQAPRLAPFREAMRDALAKRLGVEPGRVNVKITSTDALGAIGRGEGIAAQAVALVEERAGA
ncbi:MAG: 2-C-methyl-D-erythritol 2,4-cyclodiphosphate synthase [Proteobacteria bacterium]|nr:MAG: 2-C-methyl-D-erythritol 2,4-cyclodiphosphate synthase [Pseudomonadota bacterium]